MTKMRLVLISFVVAVSLPCVIFADTNGQPVMSAGDISWVLVSSALVMFMTLGVAFFYGGLVRQKNVITTMFQVLAVVLVVSIQWVVVGYSLAFGQDFHHLVGNLEWVLFRHVDARANPAYASTIPHIVFGIFQMMFAIITPALIIGGLAERVKISSFLVFITLWATFIYDPLTHWVWGEGGWLHNLGILDFAGGTVVHVSSGVAGLVAAMYLGKRVEFGFRRIQAHNVPLVLLGTTLLWFGWFGFNAGSALQANALSAEAFLTTNTAAASAAFGWILLERLRTGRVTLVGACVGVVAGLVAITPAAGFVTPGSSILLGLVGGMMCYFASTFMKERLGYDDALDAFGGHGIGGTWGALATGLFSTTAVNPAAANGLFAGNPHQVWIQVVGVSCTWVFSGIGTLLLMIGIDWIMGFRVTAEEEMSGLDIVLHNESAYPETISPDELPTLLKVGEKL